MSEWLELLLLNTSKKVLPFFSPFHFSKLLPDCKSVLDLGCGDDSVLKLNFGEFYSVGVDIFEPALLKSRRKGIHSDYIRADIRKLPVKQKSFDCVLALELIEHLTEEEGYEFLKNIESIARKRVIIATPNGFIQPRQEDRHGNIWQVHKSGWNVSQLRMLGYEVKGMAGLRLLRNDHGRIRFKPALAWRLISYLTQMVAYYLPQLSSALLCTKEIKRKEEQ